ncbi:unnamed protein product [Cyclocybe aegerita]|uniref:Uncharacterized protein n=1 Tax=Cyclocybe aegerita TaxID=1973307 RepID=A0A8S0XNH1_CYCAE|nr:unnamed protein product [Cyclocybe aegerita]
MPMQDRDPSQSSQFHQNGLGQALGTHLAPPAQYTRTHDYRNPSTSPPTLAQPGAPAASHSPLTFTVQGPAASPTTKRKQIDSAANAQLSKRRRADGADDQEPYDIDGTAQGAKHWTDDEKSKLFHWLMGQGQEDHWNALRATKNSCLRECAVEVFGGKKTYQALKGCYERNFNLFKQIYAFENAHGQGATTNIAALSEADRLREYERRLQIARKAGSDVGNITARTIDHWHRVGWYDLFYRRWHGDPATTRPVQGRSSGGVGNANMGGGGDDVEDEDPATLDFNDPSNINGLNGLDRQQQQQQPQQQHPQTSQQHPQPSQQQPQQQHVYINPQDLRDNNPGAHAAPPTQLSGGPPPPPPQAQQAHQQQASMRHASHPHPHAQVPHSHPQPPPQTPLATSSSSSGSSLGGGVGVGVGVSPGVGVGAGVVGIPADGPAVNLALTQDLLSRCLQYLNLQTKVAQEKLDYLRRREAREMNELNARKDLEKTQTTKQKTERAFELINNPQTDAALRQAATDYLKKMFLND